METEVKIKVYPIRRAILEALKEAEGAPFSFAELYHYTQSSVLMYTDSNSAQAEFENLRLLGYIEAIPGFGGQYCRIAEKGVKALSIEFDRDPYIYGPHAR